MLELRPNCERCDHNLPPDAADARICRYECTFFAPVSRTSFTKVCPNCGGGFVRGRCRRPGAWREGTGLVHDPSGTRRRELKYTEDQIGELVQRLRAVAPSDR